MRSDDPELRMPSEGQPVPEAEIALIERWIEEGATYNEAWSWRPIEAPAPPTVEDEAWVRDPLDRFVLASLEEAGLEPAPPADPRTLLRRTSYAIVGLPPSPGALDRFERDPSPQAFANEVDRLLASPAFGERWGRHWLDLVRYAETYGHEFDYAIPHAWRYRDAVIRAFNADVPYDRFVIEHLAGDLVDEPRIDPVSGLDESRTLTGFWWLSQGTHAPVDVALDEAERIDNQIDVLGKAFMGLTTACARCHDHKFDAISQADYYGLSAHLKQSRRAVVEMDPGGVIEAARMKALSDRRVVEDSIIARAVLTAAADGDPAPNREGDDPDTFEDFVEPMPIGYRATGQAFARGSDERPRLERRDGGVAMSPPTVATSRAAGEPFAGTLRSPSQAIDRRYLHQRVRGRGSLRVIVDGYHLDERNALLFEGFIRNIDSPDEFAVVTHDLGRYLGRRMHVEWKDPGPGFIEVDWMLASDDPTPPQQDAPESTVAALTGAAVDALGETSIDVPAPVSVLAIEPGTSWTEHVRLRGDPHARGDAVSPGHIESLDGAVAPPGDRLALAQRLVSPEHPLTSRVMANRIWHHLFGRGLVPTVDDFGALGSPPANPPLLDHLADRLRQDWSVKNLVRDIVLSSTFAMSIEGDPRAASIDPLNTLPHRANLRRLDAESIRDSMVMLAGRFDPHLGGPSVPIHLTEFMTGRGRPGASGPIDGHGRRSVYLEVRRNFPDPFLQAFDLPVPTTTVGRRTGSNVPSQGLAMLNSPLVHELSAAWGERIAQMPGSTNARIARMFEEAYGRTPSRSEIDRCTAFIDSASQAGGSDSAAWGELAHVLLNGKEFLFLR